KREKKKKINKNRKKKIVKNKKRFIKILKARYLEILHILINYNNEDPISVDFMKVEVALRNGYDVVIGETANRTIQVIGYATSNQSSNNPADLFSSDVLRHGSINFVIPEHLQLNYYKEISN